MAWQSIMLVILVLGTVGQATKSAACSELLFKVEPTKKVFDLGEEVRLRFTIKSNCKEPVFVSSLRSDDFLDLKVIGPDGEEIAWEGETKLVSKAYRREEFTVLKNGESVTNVLTISRKAGRGFLIEARGVYQVLAEYDLGPPEYFAPAAGPSQIPVGPLKSKSKKFCIESCALK